MTLLLSLPLIQYIFEFVDDVWVLSLIRNDTFVSKINKKSSFIGKLENQYKLRLKHSEFYSEIFGILSVHYFTIYLDDKYDYEYEESFYEVGYDEYIPVRSGEIIKKLKNE